MDREAQMDREAEEAQRCDELVRLERTYGMSPELAEKFLDLDEEEQRRTIEVVEQLRDCNLDPYLYTNMILSVALSGMDWNGFMASLIAFRFWFRHNEPERMAAFFFLSIPEVQRINDLLVEMEDSDDLELKEVMDPDLVARLYVLVQEIETMGLSDSGKLKRFFKWKEHVDKKLRTYGSWREYALAEIQDPVLF